MISIKTENEIEIMAEGGKILAGILEELKKMVRPGITTKELDEAAERLVFKFGKPSFKGYNGFPSTLCVSVNEEIVHTVPCGRKLKEGDIVSIDIGMEYKGYHSDMATTVPVGKISSKVEKLIETTRKCLNLGIKEIKPGNYLGDIGWAIQRYAEGRGFGVVRDLCGHGIGKNIHEDPCVLNYGKKKTGIEIKEGMVLCVEPMLTMGDYNIKKISDGFSIKTADGSLSAHFEHTIAVASHGHRILTAI